MRSAIELSLPHHGGRYVVDWSTLGQGPSGLPFFLFCTHLKIKRFGIESVGFGHAFRPGRARLISLSEAWERAVFQYSFRYNSRHPQEVSSSSGIAAFSTLEGARYRASSELLERKIFLDAWANMCGWRSYALRSFMARMLCGYAQKLGCRVLFYQIL